jgi:phosphoribosylaminoimidazole-succinocarboxamide synthase
MSEGTSSEGRSPEPASGEPLVHSRLPLPLLHRGKVRDLYEVDDEHLLLVASDRISAFDVVMDQPIPRKGEVLTLLTAWWLERLGREDGVAHHLLAVDPHEVVRRVPTLAEARDRWARRAMLVRRTEPLPVECVVRGYLAGSAWREYRDRGTLAGEPLPGGLDRGSALPEPLFSPATKAEEGHDENITPAEVERRLGAETGRRLRDASLKLYAYGRRVCAEREILLADTKFEFGRTRDGRLLLIDEVLTPDSSRFWPRESWEPGRAQPSLDKQPLRDWLEAVPDWDRSPPAPRLPPEVVEASTERYLEIFRRLTGAELDGYRPPVDLEREEAES